MNSFFISCAGLDSTSALLVVQLLRSIAQTGRTVVSIVHQPRPEILALMDKVQILSQGEAVYFGSVAGAMKAFGVDQTVSVGLVGRTQQRCEQLG